MRRGFAACAVVTELTIGYRRRLVMIHRVFRHCPTRGHVTLFAIIGSRRVGGALTFRDHRIVTRETRADHLRMVYRHAFPAGRAVAGRALATAVDVT